MMFIGRIGIQIKKQVVLKFVGRMLQRSEKQIWWPFGSREVGRGRNVNASGVYKGGDPRICQWVARQAFGPVADEFPVV